MSIQDPEQVAALMDEVWKHHGQLDVLINNAGGQFSAPALDITPKGWHVVVETNFYGTCTPSRKPRGAGESMVSPAVWSIS